MDNQVNEQYFNSSYEPIRPSPKDIELSKQSTKKLTPFLRQTEDTVQVEIDGESITFPTSAVRLLLDILHQMSAGNAVSVIPVHAELTTQQSADFLAVSRPYLIKLINEGKLNFHMVGSHRRIFYRDLVDFRMAHLQRQKEIVEQLRKQAEELKFEE